MNDSRQKLALSYTFAWRDGTVEPVDEIADGLSSAVAFACGEVIDGKYQTIDLIGQGGMGAVYKVHHLLLRKDMALKTFRSHSLSSESWHRFQREAQAIARLKHKNIVEVFDFGIAQSGVPYYTMELLAGESLAARLVREGVIEPIEALGIFLQAAEALAHAHRQHIVHRDVKPGNIFLQPEQVAKNAGLQVKIVDFGLAKLAENRLSEEEQSLTRAGTIFGSPLYMSPEQSFGLAVDQRTDIYSFGCSLFEALVGCPPFVGDNALITLLAHQTKSPPRLKDALGDALLPQRLDSLMTRLLAKDPDKRYQSFEKIISDINYCIEDLGTTGPGENSRGSEDRRSAAERALESVWQLPAVSKMRIILAGALAVTASISCLLLIPVVNRMIHGAVKEPSINSASTVLSLGHLPDTSTTDPFKDEGDKAAADKTPFLSYSGTDCRIFRFPKYAAIGRIEDGPGALTCSSCQGEVRVSPNKRIYFHATGEVFRHPKLFERLATSNLFGLQLAQIGISDMDWGEGQLQYITKLQSLRDLNVSSCGNVNASSIKYIDQLPNLSTLDVSESGIDGQDLEHLTTLHQLQVLGANHMQNLHALCLFMAQDPDKYNLRRLSAVGSGINDEDLKSLAALTSIQELALSSNRIRGPGLEYLTKLPNLEVLQLDNNPLNGDARLIIAKLKKLRALQFDKGQFSTHDLAVLHRALPKCDIGERVKPGVVSDD